MSAPRYARSRELLERVEALILSATQTLSKSTLHYPRGHAPHFVERGEGGRVRDVDGHWYVDLMASLLAVLLGHRDPDVEAAIRAQLERGTSFPLASPLEGELAERLVAQVPCAEMVRFAKSGSDATAAAVRVARAATGRERVVAVGYHGWHDWYVGATTRARGVPGAVAALTERVAFDDLPALEAAMARGGGDIAAVILEPAHIAEPSEGYLEGVQELCRRHGAVLVFDEIVTGVRMGPGGAQAHYGVTPDLACLGKALGNGMPLAVLAGRAELMRELDEVFVSGTFAGETLSLAAALAVLDRVEREPVVDTVWETGRRLGGALRERIDAHGLGEVVRVAGLAPMQAVLFDEHRHASAAALRTLYVVTMLEHGVLTTGALNTMFAHDADDRERTVDAFDAAMARLADELRRPGLDERLEAPLIRPVFPAAGR